MKRSDFSHPRIIDNQAYAELYYKRNKKRGETLSKKYAERFSILGFEEGNVLDAGCGYGIYAIQIAKSFPKAKVTGIDLSESLLQIAINVAQEEHVSDNVTFQKQDVQKLPFTDNFFNLVLNVNMMHIVEKPTKMINELERVLAPYGILVIADIKRSWIGHIMPLFKTAFTFDEAKNLINHSKLQKGQFYQGFFWWGFEMIKNQKITPYK